MPSHRGFFDFTSPAGLRNKLHRDFDRLRENPVDQDVAFNFFVTAHSMIDWVYGKRKNPSAKAAALANPLLKACSHLANGAKHFQLDNPRHNSVSRTEATDGAFDPGAFDPGAFHVPRLIVHLDQPVSGHLGSSIDAVTLAAELIKFWDSSPDVS